MIHPLGNRLLITPIKEKSTVTTASGFMLDDQEFKAPQSLKGLVAAIGPDVVGIEVGDTIMVSQFAPTQVLEKPGDRTMMVPAEDVLCVIRPDKDSK